MKQETVEYHRLKNYRDAVMRNKSLTETYVSPDRQEKKRIMAEQGLKTGKQYRHWAKDQRRKKEK